MMMMKMRIRVRRIRRIALSVHGGVRLRMPAMLIMRLTIHATGILVVRRRLQLLIIPAAVRVRVSVSRAIGSVMLAVLSLRGSRESRSTLRARVWE